MTNDLFATMLSEMPAQVREVVERLRAERDEMSERNAHLVRATSYDALTGLRSRAFMQGELTKLWASACYQPPGSFGPTNTFAQPFALLLIDIDHFKSVNDTYGHDVGDVVLRRVAEVIGEAVRGTDIAGRWGGEEFLVLLPETSQRSAMYLAARLRAAIADAVIAYPGGTVAVTASIGVSGASPIERAETPGEVVKLADQALYEAKGSGRNRVQRQFVGDAA